jgi:tRNA (guanosine-2'-O-)-methyltransferase
MLLSQLELPLKEKYLEYLAGFITPERKRKIEEVSLKRTRYLTVVLEDIFQPHNASAVLRSCDCFGILDLHIIENEHKYRVNPDVALGSAQWLNLYTYNEAKNNTLHCLETLKRKGYRIVATSPHDDDVLINDLPLEQKTALVFGNEPEGLSKEATALADTFVKIPMTGSAAICLFTLTGRLRNSNLPWMLTPAELIETRIAWVKNNIKKSDIVEREYLARLNEK